MAERRKKHADEIPNAEGPRTKKRLAFHEVLSAELGMRITPNDIGNLPPKMQKMVRRLLGKLLTAKELSDTDELTGLPNRRATVRELEDMRLRRSSPLHPKRKKQGYPPATIIELDLNDFKDINDLHGHNAGDAAIKHVAKLVRQELYPTDFFGRIGGDEFIVIMRNSTEEESRPKIGAILKKLAETPLTIKRKGEPLELYVTACYGATQMRENDTRPAIRTRLHRELEIQKGLHREQLGAILTVLEGNAKPDTGFFEMYPGIRRTPQDGGKPPSRS